MPNDVSIAPAVPALGRLIPVDLREVWADEAAQFTPWLAQPENLTALGEALEMQLIQEQTEVAVGSFSADIQARNAADNSVVVIENQLEQTDHTHLGQILTYLAGLDANTVIWVARRIRDEHRAAVEWLNSHTTEDYRFFAIEVELWRIGTSSPAPRFSIVVKPNGWVKLKHAQVHDTPDAIRCLTFWTRFKEWMDGHETSLRMDKPSRSTNLWLPVPGTAFLLSVFRAKGRVGLFVRPRAIEGSAEGQSTLSELDALRSVLIEKLGLGSGATPRLASRMSCDPDDEAQWDSIFKWLSAQIESYSCVEVWI